MSTDLPISPTDAFPSDIQQNKRFTIEEGMLKDVGANIDITIWDKTATCDRDSVQRNCPKASCKGKDPASSFVSVHVSPGMD